MKIGFYPRLALNGIRKNKRLYFPYILTGSVMVMMYYILSFLASTEMLEYMKGGGSLRTMLPFGCAVIGCLASVVLKLIQPYFPAYAGFINGVATVVVLGFVSAISLYITVRMVQGAKAELAAKKRQA